MKLSEARLKTIPDSRGDETLGAVLQAEGLTAEASVPAGKSTGSHEAVVHPAREAISRFESVKTAISKQDFAGQKDFDDFLISLDGTPQKSNLGGNLILALSLAWARLQTKREGLELFQYIQNIFSNDFRMRPNKTRIANSLFEKNSGERIRDEFENLPRPIFNVIEGGVHVKSAFPEFQEFQVIPVFSDTSEIANFGDALGVGREFYYEFKEFLEKKFGKENICLGDEAGFSAPFRDNEEALETLFGLIQKKNYPLVLGMDFAASQFFRNGVYILGERGYPPEELLKYYLKLISDYQIIALEDPFAEEAFDDFGRLEATLERRRSEDYLLLAGLPRASGRHSQPKKRDTPMVITDDLTTTNPERLKLAIQTRAGQGIVIKPNQIGTLSETLEVARIAQEAGWVTIISHRSGETMDDFIGDLAVALGAWGIKAGAPAAPERLVKYERIVKITSKFQAPNRKQIQNPKF